jgi:hypothetical protein
MTAADLPQELWDQELTATEPPPADWLWQGLVKGGSTTLLTALWKAGKTTLLALLLARRKAGGTLGGLAVRPGKSVVITEEPPSLWAERARRHDFGGQVCFLPQPFLGVPRPDRWLALLERILTLRQQHGIDLAVIDPLAPFFLAENSARSVLDTLLPLGTLTRAGMAVLALHHPARGHGRVGQAARGSGALLGHVDISVEMRHPGGDALTRRRRLLAWSRYPETPRQLLVELDADGTDYQVVADDGLPDPFPESWPILRTVFEDAPQKLTCQDVREEWPPDHTLPSGVTLRAWLKRAVDAGLIAIEGAGRKSDPWRYWLPEREAAWREINPFYDILQQQARDLKLRYQSLHEIKEHSRETGPSPGLDDREDDPDI